MAFEGRLGDITVRWRPPETTRDVLDYRVYISTLPDNTEQVRQSIRWVSKWVIRPAQFQDPDELFTYLFGDEETSGERLIELVALCNSVADSAGLPDEHIASLEKLLDRQNEVPLEWKQESSCKCLRCKRDDPEASDDGCIYTEAGPAVLQIAKHAGALKEGASTDPYYLTQVRGVVNRAESRRLAYERQQREEERAKKDAMKRSHGYK